ncbi:hypothetical protein PF008_g12796 [Phytophthora fragariae]|uniref:Secreted protein n=1 Tax=Phytophthora fragariae TaxID=53985 RepID=A0A6G0RNB9_9STRA|nr:hypothetical protein PF008_g12796 [Phytophthora fragariae]
MVSVLVLLLNVHWWAHAGSCFKKSRATASKCICRYIFPRDRVGRTNFHHTGARLCRKVAREFVNGYNPVMVATFKSNDDVQVLFGGGNR